MGAARNSLRWSVVGTEERLAAIAPLARAWRDAGADTLLRSLPAGESLTGALDDLLRDRVDGGRRGMDTLVHATSDSLGREPPRVLVLEAPGEPSLRWQHRWTLPARPDAAAPVVGWLRMDPEALAGYARRAAAVLARRFRAEECPPVLLAPREHRYQELLDILEATLSDAAGDSDTVASLRWSAERIRRPTLIEALAVGAGAVLYAGHGNAASWLAYGGLGVADIVAASGPRPDEATNALFFSLGCSGARPGGIADALVAHGWAGSVLAPLGDPRHGDNRRVALALIAALASGRRALPDLVEAIQPHLRPASGYIIVGDPGLQAHPSAGALRRARAIAAPPPHAALAAGAHADTVFRENLGTPIARASL